MVRASKGFRRGTRRKLKRGLRDKFKPQNHIPAFKPGDKVRIDQKPASQRGMPHPKFKAALGTIKEKRGLGYLVSVRIGGKEKQIIARGEHLKPV